MALNGTLAWNTGIAPLPRPPPLLPMGFMPPMPPPKFYCCCIGKPPPPLPPPNPPIEAKGSEFALCIMPMVCCGPLPLIGFGMNPIPPPLPYVWLCYIPEPIGA